ncbi:UNVERIFIED_CONTAM: hypothetical protein Sangu_2527400 [Sesamum angustifolium]|uniref:Uncharacterized protein n=1 Tax=Sesamum angustifolium TaxID=2727405 RepID=A0AAW2JDV1_9LAMI
MSLFLERDSSIKQQVSLWPFFPIGGLIRPASGSLSVLVTSHLRRKTTRFPPSIMAAPFHPPGVLQVHGLFSPS